MADSEPTTTTSRPGRARIFISYKRNSDPDEKVALQVHEALLRRQHDVFIDQTMLVGTRWAERIEAELRRSDFLITLLSAQSINSEMVQGEMTKVTERLDKSELRDMEGRLLTRRGQILDLERKVPLTQEERAYLNTLRGDVERLQQDIADIRAEMLKRKTAR